MTARRPATPTHIVVPPDGLVHASDRDDLAWIKTRGRGQYSVLISATLLGRRITGLAREIILEARRKKIKEIHFLVVLKGAVFFGCRLAQEIFRLGGPNVVLHFIHASSYGKSTRSAGYCRITGKLNLPRDGNVMVIEDICDTGLTLDRLKRHIGKKTGGGKNGLKSIKTCVLLDKSGRRLARHAKSSLADFVGFQIPDVFVAGFGLDHAEKYRELPFIVAVNRT